MLKSGTKPTPVDHRDFSHKSFGAISVPFPASYNTDAGLWMPNQNIDNPTFNIPALPFGCTDYTQADVANDEVGQLEYDPLILDNKTNANASGGTDVRTALKAAVSLGWITGYFNIEAIGQDMFDAVRDAMVSGGTEKRSVSVGSKWFPEFEMVNATGILPMPDFNGTGFTWHNYAIKGWKMINDQPYLVVKSWQGSSYGDSGWCYMSRTLFNELMSISGSVAFTTTKGVLPPISTISLSWLKWLISYARFLLPY